MTTTSLRAVSLPQIKGVERWAWLILTLASALGVIAYLLVSRSTGYVGYPLDDGWIHQTYARNIAQFGEFSFVPGIPSAGSTAPLWSLALALGQLLRLEPRAWSYALGLIALIATSLLAFAQARLWLAGRWRWALAAGLVVAFEWHLIWGAVSGMETLLFAALCLAALTVGVDRPALLGLLTGLAVATRPDGWLLAPFVIARVALPALGREGGALDLRGWRNAVPAVLRFGAVFAVSVAPVLALNWTLGGSIFPNTMAAKAVEQAFLFNLPILERAFWHCSYLPGCEPGPLLQPWVGGQALLLPGLLAFVVQRVRRRAWADLIPAAWALTLLCAYAYRLPIIYQHGRYQIPAIPALVLSAWVGMAELVRLDSRSLLPRVASRIWVVASLASIASFILIGARTYARDVAFIETEMVAGALWIRDHTPADSVVASHDIGALGYFSGRRIRDLAGLVDPEIIPFLGDEDRLAQWLDEVGVDYVMTMQRFTPRLVADHPDAVIYVSPYAVSTSIGYDQTLILRWGGGAAP